MGVTLFIFSGQNLRTKLTMVPPAVFDIIEKNKWFVIIGNFLFHQWLNRFLTTSGAFEIYFKDIILFSKLSSNRLPTEHDIHRQLKKLSKKSKKKVKHNDDNEEDDEDI